MKFQLLDHYPGPGNHYISAGTIIDLALPQWAPLAAGPMPICAMALDQEAADMLSIAHPHSLHLLRAGPGVTIRKLINT